MIPEGWVQGVVDPARAARSSACLRYQGSFPVAEMLPVEEPVLHAILGLDHAPQGVMAASTITFASMLHLVLRFQR